MSFLVGFALQSMSVTFYMFGAGVAVLLLVRRHVCICVGEELRPGAQGVLPPWAVFNKHPVQWLPVLDTKKTK